MAARWESWIDRWVNAGVLDADGAARIRTYEAEQADSRGLRLPILIALALGGITLGAGVLLFVAAHWEDLSPSGRFTLVLLMVAMFHVAGAMLRARFENMATALHGLGTVALGAGIFLGAQIFNLQEHWPSGFMLWAIGAAIGWALLRDPVQATLTAILAPTWLASEWLLAIERNRGTGDRILFTGFLMLAITYLTCATDERTSYIRRSLALIGGIAIIPSAVGLVVAGREAIYSWFRPERLSAGLGAFGWAMVFCLPLALAASLRKRAAVINLGAAAWVWALGAVSVWSDNPSGAQYIVQTVGPYLFCGLGAVGMVVWGIHEARKDRINLGIIGFAITILTFYFSTMMDKLGRSASLIGLGLLFLLGGWELERLRRRLVAQVRKV